MASQNDDQANDSPKFTVTVEQEPETEAGLDPYLQELLLKLRDGQPLDPSQVSVSETGEMWVDVVARLKDAAVEVPGLEIRSAAGSIVTARARVQDLLAIRQDENVLTLQAARPIGPAVKVSPGEGGGKSPGEGEGKEEQEHVEEGGEGELDAGTGQQPD